MEIKGQAFDYYQYLYGKAQTPLIKCFMSFDSFLDKEILKKSFLELKTKIPILNCRYDSQKRKWIPLVNLTDKLQIKHIDKKISIPEILDTSINIEREGPLKILYIYSEGKSYLVFVASHLFVDGKAFLSLIYFFVDIYSMLKNKKYISHYSHLDIKKMNDRDFNVIFDGQSQQEKKLLLKVKKPISLPKCNSCLQFEKINLKRQIDLVTIDDCSSIHDAGKKLGFSLNDILLGAYALSIFKNTNIQDLTLPCPIDLRCFKRDSHINLTNLTGNLSVNISRDKATNLISAIRIISNQTHKEKSNPFFLKGPYLLTKLYRILPKFIFAYIVPKISFTSFISYTNLGVINSSNLLFDNLKPDIVYIVTADKKNPYFQVSISTYENKISLTSSSLISDKDHKLVINILQDIKNNLQNF